jgi:hypothetical protein
MTGEKQVTLERLMADRWPVVDVADRVARQLLAKIAVGQLPPATVALHRQALVIENGAVVERWDIVARDRELTV